MKKWMVLVVALLAGCTTSVTVEQNTGFVGISTADSVTQRARTFTNLAEAYYQRAQYKVALDELRKAISADSSYAPAYNVYGLVYMDLGEDKLAEENFRRAIELKPNDPIARTNFGWFLCTRGQYDAGQAQFTEALANPLNAQPERALTNAGLCAEKKGDLLLAEEKLLQAQKLQPGNPNTLLKLANVNFRQGRLMDARRLLDRHDELAPVSAESLWLGVRLERKLGDRSQEAAYGLQLRKHFPDSNEARQLLAGQYE